MSKKLLVQTFLIFLTLILTIIFFYKTFKKEEKVSSQPETIINDTKSNLIEGI